MLLGPLLAIFLGERCVDLANLRLLLGRQIQLGNCRVKAVRERLTNRTNLRSRRSRLLP